MFPLGVLWFFRVEAARVDGNGLFLSSMSPSPRLLGERPARLWGESAQEEAEAVILRVKQAERLASRCSEELWAQSGRERSSFCRSQREKAFTCFLAQQYPVCLQRRAPAGSSTRRGVGAQNQHVAPAQHESAPLLRRRIWKVCSSESNS